MKALNKLYVALDMPSGTGIGLIVLNTIGWIWFDVLKRGLSASDVALVAAIFAAKTSHGIFAKEPDR